MASSYLDREFIAQQKQRLQELKAELERVRDGLEEDQRFRAEEEEDFTEHDAGDMSQSLFTREVDATVEQQVERRLENVERALQKIGDRYLKGALRRCRRRSGRWKSRSVTARRIGTGEARSNLGIRFRWV
jgi:RNA polymerase-binding transcription factor DksA